MALSRCLSCVLSRQTAASRWVFVLQLKTIVLSSCSTWANMAKVREECCHFGSGFFIWYYLTASCLENITMLHEAFGMHQWWHLRHLLLWGTMNVASYVIACCVHNYCWPFKTWKCLSCHRQYDMNKLSFSFSYLSKGRKYLKLRKLSLPEMCWWNCFVF